LLKETIVRANIILDERFHALARGLTLCIACLLSFSFHVLAQESPLRHIPIGWFEEADRHAPHWHVQFDPPTLTYSQRLVVGVRALVPTNGNERGPDWHIILRIADESGLWFQNYDYFRIDLRSMPPKAQPVDWHGYAFVQPGTYHLALVAYDAINKRHFVWRKMLRVDRPSALPDIDRDLPQVEFVDLTHIRPPIPEYLPVHTQAPAQIDVVFNLTGNEQLSLNPNNLDSFRRSYVEDGLRGATGLLSQLAPSQGCVRVSAIDILRLKVVLDRSSGDPASNLNRIQQEITSALDNAAVDVHTLAGRTKAREFFRQFLEKVISDDAGCSPQLPNPDRAIIVVSDSLIFPKGTNTEPVSLAETRNAHFFHLRFSYTLFVRQYPPFLTAVTTIDEVGHMLSSLHPRNFDVVEPKDLRRAVAEIVQDIEASSTVSAVGR
jgi:hypothetical protein